MILADTSVWIQHFRVGEPELVERLDQGQILGHPFIAGELALGSIPDRSVVLRRFLQLPTASVARHDEVMQFITDERLAGAGIGYVDACLLTAARLTPETRLWTRDRRLNELAAKVGVAFRY